MSKFNLKKHLSIIRKKAHKTMRKNGHYKRAELAGREKRIAAVKLYWKEYRIKNNIPKKK